MSGEFTSLRDRNGNAVLPETVAFSDWKRQTFLQSGSLLSSSCRAALELAGHEDEVQTAAAKFGENIAYARQVIDVYVLEKRYFLHMQDNYMKDCNW